MERRKAIQSISAVLGYSYTPAVLTAFVSSCKEEIKELGWEPNFFEPTDIPILAKLGEAFLPKTESPGAIDVGAHLFVDLFMSKVSTIQDQKVVLDGLKAWKRSFDAITEIPIGQAEQESYTKNLEYYFAITLAERQNVNKLLSTNDPMNDEQLEQRSVYGFLKKFKSLLMLGYYASEEIGENTLSYLPVPGDYQGCVPVSSVGNIWSIE